MERWRATEQGGGAGNGTTDDTMRFGAAIAAASAGGGAVPAPAGYRTAAGFPVIFFYWLIAVMPLDQHPVWGRELIGTFTIVKALGLICFLTALVRMASAGVPQLLRTAQARWFAALVVLQCASFFVHGGQVPISAYSHVFSLCTFFIAVLVLVDSQERLRRTLLLAIGAVGFASLYTIRQQQKYGDLAGFRPGGMLADANEYALVASLWMPVAFMWAFSRRPLWERVICFGSLMATLLGTTFAASRGGFLGFVAGFLFLIARSRHRLRNLALVGTLAVPLLLYFPSSALRRFTNPDHGDQFAKQARLTTWQAGLRMITSHPLTGVGIYNFKRVVTKYENPGVNLVYLAHNTYVEIAAELGVPGLIAFLGILVATFRSLERVRDRMELARLNLPSNIALAVQAGLVSYVVGAFFITAWWQKLFWLSMFLTICLRRLAEQATARPHRALRTESTISTVPLVPSSAVPAT